MKTHGNGHLFKFIVSHVVATRLKQLQKEASAKGKGEQFLAAFRALRDRLKKDPHTVGDPTYSLPNLRMTLYIVAVRPLVMNYAIHEQKPFVVVQSVHLLS